MKLNPIFNSNMVFAHGKSVRIWGEGSGEIRLTFAGQSKTIAADGRWEVEFPAMDCGGPYELTALQGDNLILLTNIWVGEVYLFAGQSNMQFKLGESAAAPETWIDESRARMFATNRLEKNEFFCAESGWRPCVKEEAGHWSAIAYHVCTAIAAEKNIAVGAVFCYQGASVIESWMPAGAVREAGILDKPAAVLHEKTAYHKWNEEGVLYANCFTQVIPFAFTGVFWYQGEIDAVPEECFLYDRELALLIDIWRYDLRDDALPFVVFAIADYDTRPDERWKAVQTCQMRMETICENVKSVKTADVCESNCIHPPTKALLSARAVKAMAELTK